MEMATVNYFFIQVLSAFAKMRKATISFVMLVRLCVRMGQLGSHRMDFHDI
jgi:hypothetical protein